MRGLGGEHEQRLQALGAGLVFHVFEQHLAKAAVAFVLSHRQAGQFGGAGVGEGVHGHATIDLAVVLQHRIFADLHLQMLAAALDQHALLFQRLDQADDVADVFDAGVAHSHQRVAGDHGAIAAAGEVFHQQRAVGVTANQVGTGNAFSGGADGVGQVGADVILQPAGGQQVFGLLCCQRADQFLVQHHAALLDHENQFFRFQGNGDVGGQFFHGQIEGLAGQRIADGRQQHQLAVVEAGADGGAVGAAHLAGVLHVHAIEHAQRLGGDEVAAGHAQVGAVHWRIGHAHGQQRLDVAAGGAGRLLDHVHGGGVGDAAVAVEEAGDAVAFQQALDLRTDAVHQHDAHAQADQEVDVLRQAGELSVLQGFAADGQHEGLAAVGVDIGGGFAKGKHEFAGKHGSAAPAGKLGLSRIA